MPEKNNNDKSGERIAKVIARAGLASRREAEAWIAAGRVAVNGAVIPSPALNVTARDRIVVDGQPLPGRARTRLFRYHKPRGLVTTHADPEGRPTIFRALPKRLPRVISVGRLDINSEGLLLLTNDGGLARALELPATGWLRRYRVRALGRVTQEALDRLRDGITVAGIHYGPIEATLDREQGANVWLTVGLREGKNREVRKVLEQLGLQVNRLIRVAYGPFELGELDDGDVEEVETEELRQALGSGDRRAGERGFRVCRWSMRWRRAIAPHPPRRFAALLPLPASGEREASGKAASRVRGRHLRGKSAASNLAATAPAGRGRNIRGRNHARGRRQIALAPDRRAEIAGRAPDRRPAARGAVQHPHPRLRRPGHGRARARPVRRHRRARHRGDLARRGLCAVRRRGRGGACAIAAECRDARPRRRHPHFPPRRHQARPRASA